MDKKKILFVDDDQVRQGQFLIAFGSDYEIITSDNGIFAYNILNQRNDIDLVISELELKPIDGISFVRKIRLQKKLQNIPVLLFTESDPKKYLHDAIKAGANDVYSYTSTSWDRIAVRLQYLTQIKTNSVFHSYQQDQKLEAEINKQITPGFWKRAMDIAFALFGIILTLPIMILTAIAIRLESKGDIIYRSKRVGAGYDIFDIYKFRSMYVGADKDLKKIASENNQYKKKEIVHVSDNGTNLIGDGGMSVPEKEYLAKNASAAFNKISGDPRVTKVGWFIRMTSIDELPQLFNILFGDMSLIGNRPLPLYEAEKLTSDQVAQRFMAPAGLTGLWQVKQRGKNVSEDERIELDNYYAQHRSIKLDIIIFFSTFKALFQQQKV